MAQLVEHNLAKVGVAGSSPVVRSKRHSPATKVAGFFRTHYMGSNPRGSELFLGVRGALFVANVCLGRIIVDISQTSLQGRCAPWLQK